MSSCSGRDFKGVCAAGRSPLRTRLCLFASTCIDSCLFCHGLTNAPMSETSIPEDKVGCRVIPLQVSENSDCRGVVRAAVAASDLAKKGALGRDLSNSRRQGLQRRGDRRGVLLGTPPDQPFARCPLSLTSCSVLACARESCSHLYRRENYRMPPVHFWRAELQGLFILFGLPPPLQ